MTQLFTIPYLYHVAYLREVDQHQETLCSDSDVAIKRRALVRIQQALIAAQEIGDEKLDIVQQVQDLIENKAKQLELDYQNLGMLHIYLLVLYDTMYNSYNFLSFDRFW